MTSYEEVRDEARAWLDITAKESKLEPLALVLERGQQGRRQLQRARVLVWLLAALVVLAWVISMTSSALDGQVCAWVTPGGVFRYGVVHVIGFVVGAALFGRANTGARMVVRALWWSALIAASIGSWTQLGTLPLLMPVMLVASCVGLSLADTEPPTAEAGGAFPLAAHRARIVVMMVLALADAQTLLLGALNHDEGGTLRFALVDAAGAGALLVAVWGLYRLRGWGLVLTLATNVAIAVFGCLGWLVYDVGFSVALVITAAIQVALGGPLLIALLRGEAPRSRRWRGLPPWVRYLVLASAVSAGVVASWRAVQPEILARHCAER